MLRIEAVKDLSQPKVLSTAHDILSSAFRRPDFDLEHTRSRIQGDILFLAQEGEKTLGLTTITFASPKDIFHDANLTREIGCYFSIAAVTKEAQGKGLYAQLAERGIEEALNQNISLVFTRTQNPLIEIGIVHALNAQVKKGHIADFSLQRFPKKGVYGRRLTESTLPNVSDPELQQAYNLLTTDQGDAYILLFQLTR